MIYIAEAWTRISRLNKLLIFFFQKTIAHGKCTHCRMFKVYACGDKQAPVPKLQMQLSGQTFHNLRPWKSVDPRLWYSCNTLIDGFWGCRIEKGPVGWRSLSIGRKEDANSLPASLTMFLKEDGEMMTAAHSLSTNYLFCFYYLLSFPQC